MACMPKMARGIHCSPDVFFLFLLPGQLLYIVKNMCIYEHTYDYVQTVYANISDCIETLYGLPLLPNKTASEPFLHKSVAV